MKFLRFKPAYSPLGNPSLYVRPEEIMAIRFEPHAIGGPMCSLTLSNGACLDIHCTDEALFSLMSEAGIEFEILASTEAEYRI